MALSEIVGQPKCVTAKIQYWPCVAQDGLLIIDICHVTMLAVVTTISGSAPPHYKMATIDNLTLARLNACCPDLTIIQVFRFISLAIKLKDNIILVQPSSSGKPQFRNQV